MAGDRIGHRREIFRWLTLGSFVGAASFAVKTTTSAEDAGDLAKVPKVVKDAADRVEPGATWLWASKVVDGNNTAWELDGTDSKKRDLTLLVTAEGKVVEVERELKNPANVPEKVLSAIKNKWPRFEPVETHEIRQGENLRDSKDGDYLYDMRGTIAKGRDIQVQVSAKGEVLESTVEVPLEKVPAVVTDALKKARPKFEIGTAYALREDMKLIGYHFEGKGPKGRDFTISVTPDGKEVEVVE